MVHSTAHADCASCTSRCTVRSAGASPWRALVIRGQGRVEAHMVLLGCFGQVCWRRRGHSRPAVLRRAAPPLAIPVMLLIPAAPVGTELPVQPTGKAKPRIAHHNLAVRVAAQSQAGRRWLQGHHLLRSLSRSRHRSRSSSRLASCSRPGGLLLRRRSARPFTCGGPPSSSLPDGSAVDPARALPSSISS